MERMFNPVTAGPRTAGSGGGSYQSFESRWLKDTPFRPSGPGGSAAEEGWMRQLMAQPFRPSGSGGRRGSYVPRVRGTGGRPSFVMSDAKSGRKVRPGLGAYGEMIRELARDLNLFDVEYWYSKLGVETDTHERKQNYNFAGYTKVCSNMPAPSCGATRPYIATVWSASAGLYPTYGCNHVAYQCANLDPPYYTMPELLPATKEINLERYATGTRVTLTDIWWRDTSTAVPPGRWPAFARRVSPLAKAVAATLVSPRERTWPATDVDGRFFDRPYARPAWEYKLDPLPEGKRGGKPPEPPVRTVHKDVPDKVRKVRRVPWKLIAALKVFHAATEFDDFTKVMCKALGGVRVRRSGLGPGTAPDCSGNPADRLAVIVENWDRYFTDPDVMYNAIWGLVYNHFEDKVAAALFGSHWKQLPGGSDRPYGSSAWFDAAYGPENPVPWGL